MTDTVACDSANMKNMKFSANLSFMFKEYPFLERYKFARQHGFKAVECAFPADVSLDEVVQAKENAGVEQILLNTYAGEAGEFGFAALPGKDKEFRNSLDMTIKLAKSLNCKKIHVMSGKVEGDVTESHVETFEKNLRYAEERFREANIVGLIEPINKYSLPKYFLNNYERAMETLKKINSPHIRLMLDIFHLQQIQGNVTRNIESYLPYVGHIQIAQVPSRGEPNQYGEINYKYVLDLINLLKYNDWIGLEYSPEHGTAQGLSWMKEFQYQL